MASLILEDFPTARHRAIYLSRHFLNPPFSPPTSAINGLTQRAGFNLITQRYETSFDRFRLHRSFVRLGSDCRRARGQDLQLSHLQKPSAGETAFRPVRSRSHARAPDG